MDFPITTVHFSVFYATIRQENFNKLMAEIRQSKSDMEGKQVFSMAELKHEVTTAQKRTSKDISQEMASSSR